MNDNIENKVFAVVEILGFVMLGTGIVGVTFSLVSSKGTRQAFAERTIGTNAGGFRLQSGANDCGPTSLQMIFDYYKIPSTIEEIEQTVMPTDKGTTMFSLKKYADHKGLYAEGWRLSLPDLMRISFPVILFVHNDHFIVADSVHEGNIFLRDPAIGKETMQIDALSRIWNGETLVFKRKQQALRNNQ